MPDHQPRRSARRIVLLALVGGLLLGGCTHASGPAPRNGAADAPTTGGTSTSAAATREPRLAASSASSVADLTRQLLDGGAEPEPLASVSGRVAPNLSSMTVDVVADVLAVDAGRSGTRLQWRLRSASGGSVRVGGPWLARSVFKDTRSLTLVDPASGRTLQPYQYLGADQEIDTVTTCLCSKTPSSVGPGGATLYAIFPPLDPSTSHVELRIPGLGTSKGLGVTRS